MPLDFVVIFKNNMNLLIGRYQQMVADGLLSVDDAITLALAACGDIGALLRAIGDPFFDKKQLVLDYMGTFYDKVIAPAISDKMPLLGSTVGKMLKSMILSIAANQVEYVFNWLKLHGIAIPQNMVSDENQPLIEFAKGVPQPLMLRLSDPLRKKHPETEDGKDANTSTITN